MSTKSIVILVVLIMITQFVGGFWALFSSPDSTWFESLQKPVFNPPSWIFAPVWIILYTFMAISIFRIYNLTTISNLDKNIMYVLYILQLLLNSSWTPMFFLLQEIGFALMIIVLLLTIISFMLYKYYNLDMISFYLWIPYVVWVLFATLLNLSLFLLN
jgi:tryptophan-rich sensory protein